jgi:hypothetical protein
LLVAVPRRLRLLSWLLPPGQQEQAPADPYGAQSNKPQQLLAEARCLPVSRRI